MPLEKKQKVDRKTHQCWRDMRQRCYNPNSRRYYTHGARGITICDRWLESYDNFLDDMGIKPDGYSIDRINNDGNYEPSNCRWATPKEQAENRRTNQNITYNGITRTISQWAKIVGISQGALTKRLTFWELEKALTTKKSSKQPVSSKIKAEMLLKYSQGGITQEILASQYGLCKSVMYKWIKYGY